METFISEVVAKILKSNNDLVNTVCVLPSERASVFLKQELKNQIKTVSFLPRILSIEAFIEEMSGLKKVDSVSLLFEFYSVFLNNNKNTKEDFDSFSLWASIAIQDFNEIDRHLADAKLLFDYLKDIKRIEEWNIDKAPSDVMSSHLAFMEKLGDNYAILYKFLVSNKKGYQGLLYREATKKVREYLENATNKNFKFIGFNALNKAEEYIFQRFLETGIGEIYWDADEYYLNSNKSAGHFLRKYKNNWKYYESNPFLSVTNSIRSKKKIFEISAPKNVSQIKYVGELLSAQQSFQNTALVLADESLLSLTLNSLPKNLKKLNITMGYLLGDMPITAFIQVVFDLYLTQEKLGRIEDNSFYYKDIDRLFSNPFLFKIFENSKSLQELKKYLVNNNQVFVNAKSLNKLFEGVENSKLLSSIFGVKQNVAELIKVSQDILLKAKDFVEGFEKECLFRVYNLFVQLQSLNTEFEHIRTVKTLNTIFNQLISSEKLSFQGEPLQGLQLMGMLETRVLDFETVIITSVNEGVLPAGKSENSFIPFDVKVEYDLPTYKEKDAIFSYHFYRIIQRAKNVYLLYNSESDEYGAGEKSRFLTQLGVDGFDVIKKSVSPVVETCPKEQVVVEKTSEVIEKLKKIAERGFSPSALATYVTNPLTYYKRYILGIKDLEEVEETIAFNTLGTVVHEVLENFYKPIEGRFLVSEDLKKMIGTIEQDVAISFNKHYKNGNIHQGKNKLIAKVAETFVLNFLQSEMKLINSGKKLRIISTEKRIKTSMNIEGLDFPINFYGEVDRIDELDGVTRIVDYKTGKVEQKDLILKEISMISEDYKYTKALQVMLYAFLYSSNNKTIFDSSLQAGIYSFKNQKEGFMKMTFGERKFKDYAVSEERVEEYMEVIKDLIREIFDESIPFKENLDSPY